MLSAMYVKHIPEVDADTLRKAESIIKLTQLRTELFEQRDALVASLKSIDNLAENYPDSTAGEFAKIARAALALAKGD